MLKTDIELLKEIYNETIPDYMNPSLDLFGKNRFDIAILYIFLASQYLLAQS
jgi:hypothetical protein